MPSMPVPLLNLGKVCNTAPLQYLAMRRKHVLLLYLAKAGNIA